jgi:predicted nucleic acid-binding protein
VVVDASALIEYLLRTDRFESIAATVEAADSDLHIPALCDVEVAAALRRVVMSGHTDLERARQAMTDYLDLPLTAHGHASLLPRMLELRDNFSAYDAAYVVLAEQLAARLLTADEALARAVLEHTRVGRADAGG